MWLFLKRKTNSEYPLDSPPPYTDIAAQGGNTAIYPHPAGIILVRRLGTCTDAAASSELR